MRKLVPMSTILGSEELSNLWVTDRMTRQASHGQARTLAAQIEDVLGVGIGSFYLPPQVVLRAVKEGEVRLRLPSGEFALYDKAKNTAKIVMPVDMVQRPYPRLGHMTDRGPIVAAVLHHWLGEGICMVARWGPFHSMWNNIKNTMKQAANGSAWHALLCLLIPLTT